MKKKLFFLTFAVVPFICISAEARKLKFHPVIEETICVEIKPGETRCQSNAADLGMQTVDFLYYEYPDWAFVDYRTNFVGVQPAHIWLFFDRNKQDKEVPRMSATLKIGYGDDPTLYSFTNVSFTGKAIPDSIMTIVPSTEMGDKKILLRVTVSDFSISEED